MDVVSFVHWESVVLLNSLISMVQAEAQTIVEMASRLNSQVSIPSNVSIIINFFLSIY